MANGENVGLFVYYDPKYDPNYDPERGERWIMPNVSQQIVASLEKKGFQRVGAEKLREVMLSVTNEPKQKVVIVFNQDVAPETVLDEPNAMALVRRYLDAGGSIIWLGDVPFYHQGKRNGKKADDGKWGIEASADILGVNTIYRMHISKAEITEKGIAVGLKTQWTGIRPILRDENIEVLAESRCSFGVAFYPLQPSKWSRLRGGNIGVGGFSLGVQLDNPVQPGNVFWNRPVANGWFKNFDKTTPNSGFVRIWDYRLSTITEQQLKELYDIAVSRIKAKE